MQTSRRQAWRNLVWRRGVITIALITGFLSAFTFWWDESYPELGRPHLSSVIRAIHWWYWVIGGLVVILALVVEGALKAINQGEDKVEEYKTKAHSPNISIVVHAISIGGPTPDHPTAAFIL